VASEAAHVSVPKSARILGLPYEAVPINSAGELDAEQLPDVSEACLVLTAGTTTVGAIDPLHLIGQAQWSHVDGAWSGPLRLSQTYAHLLKGIEQADSVAMSAHKWLFQPKDSALILFRDVASAHDVISFGGSYLANPNVGVQGSRGAAAIPLLATMMAWGRTGIVERIERSMAIAHQFAQAIDEMDKFELWRPPTTGIMVFRPVNQAVNQTVNQITEAVYRRLPEGMLSTCTIQGEQWLRSVAANPMADLNKILAVLRIASEHGSTS